MNRQLAIGYWLLAIGYWLLAIGYWLLAIGYWLLAIGYEHELLEARDALRTGRRGRLPYTVHGSREDRFSLLHHFTLINLLRHAENC